MTCPTLRLYNLVTKMPVQEHINTSGFPEKNSDEYNLVRLAFFDSFLGGGGVFPVFTLLGNPLHMDLRNACMYSFHLTIDHFTVQLNLANVCP